jgi:hypothetical protein
MPGFGSMAEVPAAWLSAATIMSVLWASERLVSPILNLERTRHETQASLVVAFSLCETIAHHAGKDDISALDALSGARRELTALAKQLTAHANRPRPAVRVYAALRGYDLAQTALGLRKLSDSLVMSNGCRLVDREAVEAGLRLGRRYRFGHVVFRRALD